MSIDVRITLTLFLSFFSSCVFLSHHFSPPSHLTYTCVCIQIYIHILIHPPALLFEPLVPLCGLLRVNSCGCVSQHAYAFFSSSIFIHTYRHLHMYGLCSVLCLSPSFCSVSFLPFLQIPLKPTSRCLLMDAQPAHIPILLLHLSFHFSNI